MTATVMATATESIGTAPASAIITAFIWIDRSTRTWNVTVAALLANPAIGRIHVGFAANQNPDDFLQRDERIVLHPGLTLLQVAGEVLADAADLVLFCSWAGKPAQSTFELAASEMARDPRIGTVSFLSNAAGGFSFPHRNTGTPFTVDGHDEATLTAHLRAMRLPGETLTPVQIPDGAMVLVSRSLLDVCGSLDDLGTQNLALALVDLALRGSKRGFNNYLDATGYVTTAADTIGVFESVALNNEARHSLHTRYPYFPLNYDVECARPASVLGEALDLARARALGLRVLVDGSALGPREMGTQVLTLKLTQALAAHENVQQVVLGVPNPNNVPAYAQELTRHRKIQLIAAGDHLDFAGAPQVDILHRPYQPSQPIPWDRWRSIAKRTVITVQDLIAYRNAAYFESGTAWLAYRDNFTAQIAGADSVLSISHDVVQMIREERLPIERERVHVVENGANARSKDQPARLPDAVIERGWAGHPFLFCLGATYAHKNRDLAIRTWLRLREAGYPHKLVLAGANVPYGSLQVEESLLSAPGIERDMLVLPDISAEDRNWLMLHASLILYPTAAEGFGLVPFEAACLDVPTLFVSFGPLRELTDDPLLPTTFDLQALTARARLLLDDPAVARASIAGVRRNAAQLTWAETGRKSVGAYFATLAQPARNI